MFTLYPSDMELHETAPEWVFCVRLFILSQLCYDKTNSIHIKAVIQINTSHLCITSIVVSPKRWAKTEQPLLEVILN